MLSDKIAFYRSVVRKIPTRFADGGATYAKKNEKSENKRFFLNDFIFV